MSSSDPARQPIAIVGVSALFPGSTDATGFWRDILAGRDLIGDVPAHRWRIEDYYDPDPAAPDKTYARRGGFLPKVDFDALGWGVPPSTLPATDTSQLLALIVAQQVLRDAARGQFETMDRSRISVVLGVTSAQELLFDMVSRLQRPVWVKSLRETGLPEDEVQAACDRIAAHYVPWQEASFPGLLGNVVAGRIANRLNLGGTNAVTDAACASTFAAISMAVNELQLGHSDLVISGGVDTLNDIFMYMCFSKTPALSPSGDCRPFSDQADGTMLGEGLGMVALKRLADAERDGDRIYAVLAGVGTSSDGRSKSVYAPVSAGQAVALRRAYELAGFGPETIELVEAHGTGTKAGDVAEFEGLASVYAPAAPDRRQWCALGSVKSQIGHTKAAAGAAGMFKAVMALHHKVLPPTIKVSAPNPKLGLANSPFYLNTAARPWIRGGDHPRRAAVSAFGFGGSNFHLALEEYRGPGVRAPRLPMASQDLVVLSADRAVELRAKAAALRAGATSLARLGSDSRRSFRADAACRLALPASTLAEFDARLAVALARIEQAPDAAFALPDGSSYGVGAPIGELAFVFPGQGSQYLGMGAAAAMSFEAARAVWDRAADLALDADASLHEVVFPRPVFDAASEAALADRLTDTRWAQPALGATSLSLLALLDELGVHAQRVGGHSFGEITALCAAGAISATDLLRIARRRGELMQAAAAAGGGAMTALGVDIARARALLATHGRDLVVANHNAPDQVVVSGPVAAVEAFERAVAGEGVSARRLPVAAAFHSPQVAAACAPFGDFLAEIAVRAPAIPVYGNADAAVYAADPAALRDGLVRQIAAPVRFVDMIEAMYADGARVFVEVGAGTVLRGLVAAILGARPHVVVALDRKGKAGVDALMAGLAQLAAAGVATRLSKLFADVRSDDDAPAPAKLSVPIDGTNVGKPYPVAPAAYPPPNPARPVAVLQSVSNVTADQTHRTVEATPAGGSRAAGTAAVTGVAGVESMSSESHVSPAWLAAFQEAQQQTAAAHAEFQRALSDSHTQYLKLAESALNGLTALLGAGSGDSVALPAPQVVAAAPPPPPTRSAAPVAAATAPVPVPVTAPAAVRAVSAAPSPAPARVAAAAGSSIEQVMLAVVAEKTGYPAEMLNLDMDLEGDLGIDSIKRVEILAAVEQRGALGIAIDRGRLGALHTLREIVDYLAGAGAGQPQSTPAAATALPSTPVAADRGSLAGTLLAIVAEKTGYPAEMLNLDMDLEGDLGVDSIKRVEILAAVEQRGAVKAQVDRARMAAMHTLREIVDYLAGASPDAAGPATAPGAGTTSATVPDGKARPGTVDRGSLAGTLLAIVAEKTGYPAEMLTLEMDLEGDLGVDSIKRVEILAAVEQRLPGLPAGDRAQLSALHTLGEIVDYFDRTDPAAGGALPTLAAEDSKMELPAPRSELGRYILERVPAPPAGFALAGLLGRPDVYVIGGGASLDAAVAAELVSRGVDARAVPELPEGATACLFLGGLRAVRDSVEAAAINREAFELAQRVGRSGDEAARVFVTVQDSGGSFGSRTMEPVRAWLAGLPALVKTAALEWPRAGLRAIDLERGDRGDAALAVALADELLGGGGEIEVGLSAAGLRTTLVSTDRPVRPSMAAINHGEVVLVSGGARGVTAACIVEWASQVKGRFVLLGRTPLAEESPAYAGAADATALKRVMLAEAVAAGESVTPSLLAGRVDRVLGGREIRRTLAQIRASGAEARYEAVTIDDAAAVAAVVARVREDWGPIAGIVHAAGVLADRRIVDKTAAQFDSVFRTKVDGLRALLAATASDPLKLLCVFSSVSARCGNTGQSDYAMANEVLAKVVAAEARRRPGLRAKALGWGPWEGGMVTPALRDRFAALGVPMIPLAAGAKMFADEMRDARPDGVELVLGGEPRGEALLMDGAEARVAAVEVQVSRGSHAFLEGHAVKGTPVVPVVLVAEWMARAARSFRPGLHLTSLVDLKVLKGIRLGGFENGGDRYRIEAVAAPCVRGAELAMSVRDVRGTLLYTATAELRPEIPAGDRAQPALELGAWSGEALYGELLFHRGSFELIDQVHGISDAGIGATVRGVDVAGWRQEPWQLDVAALDGGLQLAVLHGRRMLGAPTLPTAIAELRCYSSEPILGPLTATAYRRRGSSSESTADILLCDRHGRRYAEMLGVQVHALP